MSLLVQHIMSRKLVTVGLDDTLATVKEIFEGAHFHHLLVVEEEALLGVVSDRDLVRALSPNIGLMTETDKDAATLHKRVHQIMTRKPLTLPPEAPIEDAVRLFLDHSISCIPVVDPDFRPVGILSWRDILRAVVPLPQPTTA